MRHRDDDQLTWWQLATGPILAAIVIAPAGLAGAIILAIIQLTT